MRGMPDDRQPPPPTGECAAVAIPPDALLRAARGFSCVFWAIPIGLLLFSGALDIRVFPRLRVPAYVLGVFLAYCGAIYLQRAGALTPLWIRRVRALLFVLLLKVYLAPFVYWWRNVPGNPYYVANVALLMLVTAAGLFTVNRLGEEIGRVIRDRVFGVEARVAAWVALLLSIMPLLVFLAYSFPPLLRSDALVYVELMGVPLSASKWTYLLALLPFTLTMAVAWKAKERCLHLLKLFAAFPDGSHAGQKY
jgi:hypothetical protein